MPTNEYEDYLESESLRTGNTYIYRARTGIIETYSDGKLIEVTGTQPSSSGGGYISIVPSSTVSGGYTVSTDTPRGGTVVTELSGTTSATPQQLEQGAFSSKTYDYPSTVPKEQRIGMVEEQIASAQIRPVAYETPTQRYEPTTTEKYLPLVAPYNPLSTQFVTEQGKRVGGNPFVERSLIIQELDYGRTRFKFSDIGTYKNIPKVILEDVSYMFVKREELGYAKGSVKQYYLNMGKTEEFAQQRADIAYKSFKKDVMKEFSYDVAIGVGSNLIGAGAVGLTAKGLTALGAGAKVTYYGSRIIGMTPAGAFEGIMFRKNRVELVRQEKMTTADYLISGATGAITSVGAQIYIEQGFKGLIGRGVNIPVKTTTATNVREYALYTTDPLEPVSDAVTKLGGFGVSNVKIRTFPLSFTNTLSNSKISYYSPVFDSQFSFTFGQTKSQPISTDLVVSQRTQVFPNVFPMSEVQARPNVLSSPYVEPNNFIQPRPTPSPFPNLIPTNTLPVVFNQPRPTPSPFPNVLPDVFTEPRPTPFPNVFTGGIVPFVPPMGGGYGKGFGFNVKTKQRKAYIPSLTAVGLGIKAKKGKRIDVFSGLSVRPII